MISEFTVLVFIEFLLYSAEVVWTDYVESWRVDHVGRNLISVSDHFGQFSI